MNTAVKNYDQSILCGEGQDDYAKYMRTDTLLNLQVRPENMHHRDELLFQIVHQSTELWLKLACSEMDEAGHNIATLQLGDACALLARAVTCIRLITSQLDMLAHMTPWDFRQVRPALGNGSGFESPGWRQIQKSGKALTAAFEAWRTDEKIALDRLYREYRNSTAFNLAEALIDLDEAIALWRTRHYKVAVRTIGHGTVGTKGTQVDKLTALLNQKMFPALWEVRSILFSDATQY